MVKSVLKSIPLTDPEVTVVVAKIIGALDDLNTADTDAAEETYAPGA